MDKKCIECKYIIYDSESRNKLKRLIDMKLEKAESAILWKKGN